MISRCCSSLTARRSSSSRSGPTGRCCGGETSARSTAAVGLAEGRHVFAMIQSLQEARIREIDSGRIRRRRRRRVSPRGRRQLRPVAQPPSAARTARPDGHARASRRPRRHRVVRLPDRCRAAAVGGDRPGLPGPISVLRRRRRHRPSAADLAPRWLRARGAEQPADRRRHARVGKLLEAIERIVLDPGQMRALGFCVLQGARALHGAQVHARPASRASR